MMRILHNDVQIHLDKIRKDITDLSCTDHDEFDENMNEKVLLSREHFGNSENYVGDYYELQDVVHHLTKNSSDQLDTLHIQS